jgi:hypothetical protein
VISNIIGLDFTRKNLHNTHLRRKRMSRYYKTLAMILTAGSLVTLTGCIVEPDKYNAHGSSTGSYNQPHNTGSLHSAASGSSEWDRGCADAKAGAYDRSGNAGKAYEDGWNACHGGGGNQSGAQQQGGVEAAKKTCLFQFGSSGRVQTVSDLKPGFWEIIVTDNSGRKVACTADAQGTVSDWVEM